MNEAVHFCRTNGLLGDESKMAATLTSLARAHSGVNRVLCCPRVGLVLAQEARDKIFWLSARAKRRPRAHRVRMQFGPKMQPLVSDSHALRQRRGLRQILQNFDGRASEPAQPADESINQCSLIAAAERRHDDGHTRAISVATCAIGSGHGALSSALNAGGSALSRAQEEDEH